MFLTHMYRYKLIGALILQTSLLMHAAVGLQDKELSHTQTFTHSIKEHLMGINGQFYVASHEVGAENFAIAAAGRYSMEFSPLAPEKVMLDSTQSATNPLFNAQIEHIAIMQGINSASLTGEMFDRVAVVKTAEPTTLYLLDTILSNRVDMLSARDIKDASGTKLAGSILDIASNNDTCIYAAVTDHDTNSFGQGNSGIAIVARGQVKEQEDKPASWHLAQMDAYQLTTSTAAVTRAARLNNESSVLHIGNSTVSILNNAVNLDYDTNLRCLYTALHINAQSLTHGGAQAIVIGEWFYETIKTKDDKTFARSTLILRNLTFPAAFSAGVNNIVGGVGDNVNVSIHQTRSLLTSTSLNYLVIFGGVGTAEQTKRFVYALPVVRRPDHFNGMLAKRTAVPGTASHREQRFIEQATTAGDLFTADDKEVQVGNGPMTAGDIRSIMVYDDAVYAIVPVADQGRRPGIFHSQALFDNLGRIKEWTSWRRVAGNITDPIFGAALSQHTGNMTMITGNTADTLHTVKCTTWGTGDSSKNLVEWLNVTFPATNGGIQGLYDIPVTTPGINNISLVIATGRKQVALAQTGIQIDDIMTPLGDTQLANNPISFTDGAIHQIYDSTNAIAISGGALNEIQIIKATAITKINNAGYLFVGGTHGLAVLLNKQGCSWDAAIGLGNNFTGLVTGSTFKRIGSYKFIRKLICDDDNGLLYVISDSKFDRIDIAASDFSTGAINVTTLANLATLPLTNHDTILDAVVSRSLGIIATSSGLFRNGPQTDIRTASNPAQVGWERISLPEGFSSVRQILSITQTGREQDLTTGVGGMFYVLSTNRGKHEAMVHRFTVNTQSQDLDYEYLIQALPDSFIKDRPSYFVHFAGDRSWISTDGSLFFQERDKNNTEDPSLTLLAPHFRSGLRFGGNRQEIIPINLQSTCIMQPIVRSSASGSWLLARNNILSVNE